MNVFSGEIRSPENSFLSTHKCSDKFIVENLDILI